MACVKSSLTAKTSKSCVTCSPFSSHLSCFSSAIWANCLTPQSDWPALYLLFFLSCLSFLVSCHLHFSCCWFNKAALSWCSNSALPAAFVKYPSWASSFLQIFFHPLSPTVSAPLHSSPPPFPAKLCLRHKQNKHKADTAAALSHSAHARLDIHWLKLSSDLIVRCKSLSSSSRLRLRRLM